MIDAFIGGLLVVLQLRPFLYMLIGATIGFWVGILPGIGGAATLALIFPFIYKMTPQEALPFLLGMHSVLQTTGDITSILFGIPGEPSSVATIVDGYPMSKKGEAGRALGAALMSSLVGAIIGAGVLALSIPVVRPLVLALGSPEMFMVIILGLTCISSLSGQGKRGLLLGLMSAGLGFMCSMVGQDRQAGVLRFTFGQIYLWNGIPLVPMLVGLFAIPEVVDLAVKGTAIAGDVPFGKLGKGVREGIRDTFRHFWLTVRCSIIGSLIGILPGLGGSVAQWVSYAHAAQSAKTVEEQAGFGKGDVRGVLGPGAANNSKEGGQLIPTVAFGVPASAGGAILLGAFLLMGLVPGPDMLTKHLTLTYSLVWTIVLANIIVVAVSLLFINHIASLTTIRGNLIIPFILLMCFIGAYTSNNHFGDLIVVLVFGGISYLMVRFGWPRPPFVLGVILGRLAEVYLFTSIDLYEAAWLYRPKVIILFFIAVAVALYPFIQRKRLMKKEGKNVLTLTTSEVGPRPRMRYSAKALMSLGLVIVAVGVVITALKWKLKAALFPVVIGIPVIFLAVANLLLILFGREEITAKRSTVDFELSKNVDQALSTRRTLLTFTWIIGFLLLIVFFGFPIAVPLFVLLYLKLQAREGWGISLILTFSAWGFFWGLFVWLLKILFSEGWVIKGLRMLGIG